MTALSPSLRCFTFLLLIGACGGASETSLFGTDTPTGQVGGSGGRAGVGSGAGGTNGQPGGSSGATPTGGSAPASGGVAGAPSANTGGRRMDGVAGEPGEQSSTGGVGATNQGGASQASGGALAAGGKPGTSGGQGGQGGESGEEASSGQGGSAECLSAPEVCDGLDNDCDNQSDEGGVCPKGCQGYALEGRGYLLCTDPSAAALAFDTAAAFCAQRDMHLAWLESKQENDAVLAAFTGLGSTGRAWIGASDAAREGQWHWVDADGPQGTAFWAGASSEVGGAPVGGRYNNWAPERPNDETTGGNEDCASLTVLRDNLPTGTWNDDTCTGVWPFVCEAN